jgi:quinol monooxygenase YgiN
MPTPLTIVATIQALPGHEVEVEKALTEVISPTLAEPGCLQYDLHRDLQKPGLFLFYENWSTKEEWEAHMESGHLAAMKKSTEGKLEETIIFQMERV